MAETALERFKKDQKDQEESKKLDILAGQVQRLIDHFKL